ncbi:TetR/AcrR family transcriptional regulator [Algivirga pacifica]|uniref:TetR/AcrR family transcriptional regulator n=1 Tax=Algivirga pacifica TaxID=1162670 RepID=A0ABP9DBI6_9BACT
MESENQRTEDKIKQAATKIFQSKGYAATKTRDIAEEAGINLALVNYYFRSKKKLFEEVMLESLQGLASAVITIFKDESTTLDKKVTDFVHLYIDMLSENENLATFLLNSVRENPEFFIKKTHLLSELKSSSFIIQYQEAVKAKEIPPLNPTHFILNLIGLTVFPFISKPMVQVTMGTSDQAFQDMVEERKRLVPLWIKSMMTVK